MKQTHHDRALKLFCSSYFFFLEHSSIAFYSVIALFFRCSFIIRLFEIKKKSRSPKRPTKKPRKGREVLNEISWLNSKQFTFCAMHFSPDISRLTLDPSHQNAFGLFALEVLQVCLVSIFSRGACSEAVVSGVNIGT